MRRLIIGLKILLHSHRLNQWVQLYKNYREVKDLWNYLADSHLIDPEYWGLEYNAVYNILNKENKTNS